ncbi:Uncharacterised protein [Legionella cincinnatiensis]|uniref:Uncharacterized protein n=1 Tax=Legionella cincinnatiensis TaxID=28085 RepID=A0A378IFS2_9GAMM|nr:Uncharacterised protein [Legionella cincinnatiensis]
MSYVAKRTLPRKMRSIYTGSLFKIEIVPYKKLPYFLCRTHIK